MDYTRDVVVANRLGLYVTKLPSDTTLALQYRRHDLGIHERYAL